MLVWFLEVLARNVHSYWGHAAFACLTVWFFWAGWDVLSNPDNPYHKGHSQARRNTHAAIAFVFWLLFATWYVYSLVHVYSPAAN